MLAGAESRNGGKMEADFSEPQMAAADSGQCVLAELSSGEGLTMENGSGTTVAVLDPSFVDLSGAYFGSAIESPLSQKGGKGLAKERDKVPANEKIDDTIHAPCGPRKKNEQSLIDLEIKQMSPYFQPLMSQNHALEHSKKRGLPEQQSRSDQRLGSYSSSQSRLFGQSAKQKASRPRLSNKPVLTSKPDTQTRGEPRNLMDLSPRSSTMYIPTRLPNLGSRSKTSNAFSPPLRYESSDLIGFSESLAEPRTPTGSQILIRPPAQDPYESSDLMQFSETSGSRTPRGSCYDKRRTSDTGIWPLPEFQFSGFGVPGLSNRISTRSSSAPSSITSFGDPIVLPKKSLSAAERLRFRLPEPTASEAPQQSGQSRGIITARTAANGPSAIGTNAKPLQIVNPWFNLGSHEAYPRPQSTCARFRLQGEAGENLRRSLLLMAESEPGTQIRPQSAHADPSSQIVTAVTSQRVEHRASEPRPHDRPRIPAVRSSAQSVDKTIPQAALSSMVDLERAKQFRPQSTHAQPSPRYMTAATPPGFERRVLQPENHRRPQSAAAPSSAQSVYGTIAQESSRASLGLEPEHHPRPQNAAAQSNLTSILAPELETHPHVQSTSAHSATVSDFQSMAGSHHRGPLQPNPASEHASLPTPPTMFSPGSVVATRRADPSRDIMAVLEGWYDEGYISQSWASYIELDEESDRTRDKINVQIQKFEHCCRESLRLNLSRFQVYGTPDMFDYDVVKCWVHFGQHLRYGSSKFPPGYMPVYGGVDDPPTAGSDFTYY
ncbi:MAG: hypothetical protein Q9170_007664 [Blastenia crenularia]